VSAAAPPADRGTHTTTSAAGGANKHTTPAIDGGDEHTTIPPAAGGDKRETRTWTST
jgi:hypothetical protein